MSRTKLGLKTLHKIHGLEEEFDRLLGAATEDCLSRPGIKKTRQIMIVVDVMPNPNDVEQCFVKPYIKNKMPVRKGSDYVMNTTVKNELTFQPNSPMEPDQGGLFED